MNVTRWWEGFENLHAETYKYVYFYRSV